MSDFDEWDDDDSQESGNAVAQLRKANKAKEKQIRELQDQLDSLRGQVRDRSVKDTIKSRGLPEKISALIPKDLTTSEEVEAWINDYADVFGPSETPAAQEQQTQQQAPPAGDWEALSRISNTQSTGQPFSGDPDQILGLIKSAGSEAELSKLLFGNANGPLAS